MSSHPIVHIEVASSNPDATGNFYKEVFGWKIETDDQFHYVQFIEDKGKGPSGGFPAADGKMYKPGEVLLYIGTDDIEKSLREVEACGGKTVLGKTEIPGMGWFAFFSDPTGNKLALFQGVMQQT
jgi:uncharacterized protein